MSEIHSMTLTFLMTDTEGSTRLWELYPGVMNRTMERHDEIAQTVVPQYGGELIRPRGEGDSLFIVFKTPEGGARGSVALMNAFVAEVWPAETQIKIRAALHTCAAEYRDGDYYGPEINRCARLRAAAHGGQLLVSNATRTRIQAHLPEGVSLREMGTHRLKDLLEAETIFQVLHPDLLSEFPPLNTHNPERHNLPAQRSSYTEGELKVETVLNWLEKRDLITLIGPGGVGKTRLSAQTAAATIEAFPDGVWFAALETLAPGDNARVASAVAAALNVIEEPTRPLLDTLREHLKDKCLLLLLDNCEHVLEGCAELMDSLLRACPQLKVLAASRSALGVAGEQEVEVLALNYPRIVASQAPLTAAACLQFPAPRLFVERARLVRPDFEVTAENAPLIAQICERLDGSPLLIELTAPAVKFVSLTEIARDLPRVPPPARWSAPLRHQSARAVIEWSEQLLPADAKQLLRRLAVFVGGFTLEAARAVCADPSASAPQLVADLSHLVANSLVQAEKDDAGNYRYRLLHVIREHYLPLLTEAGELETLQARHRTYFLKSAEDAEPRLQTSEAAQTLDLLAREQDNIRAALRFDRHNEAHIRLAVAMVRFWQTRNAFAEGREWLEAALAENLPCAPIYRIKAWNGTGVLALKQGNFEAARERFTQARAAASAANDMDWYSRSTGNLGQALADLNENEAARSMLEESLQYSREQQGTPSLLALNGLGILLSKSGEHREAYQCLMELAELLRAKGNLAALCICLHNLGELARNLNDLQAAEQHLREGVLLCYELGNRAQGGFTLAALALTSWQTGQFRQAAQWLATALLLLELPDISVTLADRAEYDAALADLREQMKPAAFRAAWNKGRKTPLADIVRALSPDRRQRPPALAHAARNV